MPLLISCLEPGKNFQQKKAFTSVYSCPFTVTATYSTYYTLALAKCYWLWIFAFAGLPFQHCAVGVELFTPLTLFSYIICHVFPCSSKHDPSLALALQVVALPIPFICRTPQEFSEHPGEATIICTCHSKCSHIPVKAGGVAGCHALWDEVHHIRKETLLKYHLQRK